MKRFLIHIVVHILEGIQQYVVFPLAHWAAPSLPVAQPLDHIAAEPNPKINALVLDGAIKDMESRATSETSQADLNACLEALRPQIAQQMRKSLAAFSIQYNDHQEGLYRIFAYAIQLGMFLERRLQNLTVTSMNRCIITITTPEPQSDDADITIEFDPPIVPDSPVCTTVERLASEMLLGARRAVDIKSVSTND